MTTVTRYPLELQPGMIITNPHTSQRVEVAGMPVRHYGRVSIDYRIPDDRAEGIMVVAEGAMITVHPTARQRQHAAAHVLADLLTRDLPALTWTIGRRGAVLTGSILGEADTVAAAVCEWADALGVEPRREEVGDAGVARPGAVHIARASVDGVTVSIEGYAQAGQMTFDERLAALDQMSTGEHYMALAWMAEHEPEAFRRAAAYVQQVRERDAAAEDGR